MTQSNTTDQPPSPDPGPRVVRCVKLGRELPGLPARPFPNDLGQRIYESISLEAWRAWMQHSQMLINERELKLSDPQAREFLMQECETFLFGAGSAPPPGWVPPGGGIRIVKKK